jgi:hypothetical protein
MDLEEVFNVRMPVCLLIVLASAGCGGGNGYYPVSGKVLHDGAPAVGAVVYFCRQGEIDRLHEHVPQGVVGDDGTFTLASPAGAGALPGAYAVLIEWKKGAGELRGRGPGLASPDRFQGRYMDPNNPVFQAEVKAEKNQLPPFELR